ncbi:heavy metal translocating P-type ATPase [Peptoniphilus duerdenii]|uniref:heavy metal translocating P-type ATPase n=1 Tax=Peptoniphilus duerdenii TaxID=507750 RepID=UPI0023F27658|nr:heavy metal translocating P-type ATPase [Peptoniphilus duerdenii]
MKTKFYLKGLNCPNCSAKIVDDIKKYDGINDVNYDLINEMLYVEHEKIEDLHKKIEDSVNKFEDGIEVLLADNNSQKNDEEDDEKEDFKKNIIIYSFVLLMLIVNHFVDYNLNVKKIVYLALYVVVGYEVVFSAFKNILKGQIFDEQFLMMIATFSAIAIGEYPEAVAVMLFYSVGELLQDIALDNSRKNIKSALEIKPEFANVLDDKGNLITYKPEDVNVGQIILVKPGEKVPLDGEIIEGESYLDTSILTGESVPIKAVVGEELKSGSINKSHAIKLRVTKEYSDGAIAKIIDMVENASQRKANVERKITKFAKVYTPVVCAIALLLVVFGPSLFKIELREAVYRACVFLVISCPCAFIISVPLGIFGGIGAASKNGVFVKGGNYLEALKDVGIFVFDKTGTITKGVFEVSNIKSYEGFSEEDVLEIAAAGEMSSNHPIAKAIVRKSKNKININDVVDFEEVPGKGIKYILHGKEVLVGNNKIVDAKEVEGTNIFVSYDKKLIGEITVSDIIKPEAKDFINSLKKNNIKTYMLSGDEVTVTENVAKEVGIDHAVGGLLPEDKVAELIKIKEREKKLISFVGDGVNDSPVIAVSDIGISMGMSGSDIAVEASDIVILKDNLNKIIDGIKISRNTVNIVNQNIILAFVVKVLVLGLAGFGHASIWLGVFADVGVALLAVLNALRALKPKLN